MILSSHEFSEELFSSISKCQSSFQACSAFIKLKALQDEKFGENLDGKNVVVVARWQKHDLLAGASDLDVYTLCKENGWKFGIDLNLHGKLFVVDDSDIFLGSANLTQKGLHIGLTGNHEFGTRLSADQADLNKIDHFIQSEVTWMTDGLFELMLDEILESRANKLPVSSASWSKTITESIDKPVEFLWVQELIFSSPKELLNLDLEDERAAHDFDLLGLNIDDFGEVSLRRAFKRSRLYRWLTDMLCDGNLSFGGVTARLHSAVLDDPKPYRVDIKNYNKIIFQWAEFLTEEFEVSQPNYSQVLSLKSRIDG